MKKIILIFIVFFMQYQAEAQQKESAEANYEKFKQFYSLVYNYYMDTVDFNQLIETAISKSLENLDPHSVYIEPTEAKNENERLQGSFEGIGISYNVIRDTLNILNIIPNGPSEKIGLLAGDKMIAINDTVFAGTKMSNDAYVSRLKGKKGTKVKVKILRENHLVEFVITRDVIPLHSVDASFMINSNTGYIKLNKFANTTPYEVDTAFKKLLALGMKTLILDLQNNGGGLLNAAIALSDEFTEPDKLIVYTEGLHSPRSSYNATSTGNFKEGKLIVLVNQYSASASEITAGAIQDWDRGLLIGRRSFGKGLVQRPFMLKDNSQVRLTTAKYYTPSGRCIQKSYSEGQKEYNSDIYQRLQNGSLTKADTIKVPDSLMKYTQNGRKVYGGGGITPDIYVPLDTTMNSEYYFQIVRKGILNTFCTDYVSNNKVKLLTIYPNEDYFISKFSVSDDLLNQLIKEAEENDIKRNDSSIDVSKKLISTIMKANIGRGLYSTEAFYKAILDIDPLIQKALQVANEDFSKYKVRNK